MSVTSTSAGQIGGYSALPRGWRHRHVPICPGLQPMSMSTSAPPPSPPCGPPPNAIRRSAGWNVQRRPSTRRLRLGHGAPLLSILGCMWQYLQESLCLQPAGRHQQPEIYVQFRHFPPCKLCARGPIVASLSSTGGRLQAREIRQLRFGLLTLIGGLA